MPTRAKRPCSWPGCNALSDRGRCERHAGAARRQADTLRPGSRQRGYTKDWERARAAFLAEHPLCAECKRDGRTEAAGVVDHIVPHRGDPLLFWDEANWQPLCVRCHNRKTARGE